MVATIEYWKVNKKSFFLKNYELDWNQTVHEESLIGPYKVLPFYMDQKSKKTTVIGQSFKNLLLWHYLIIRNQRWNFP
jgi:hypothetical protein